MVHGVNVRVNRAKKKVIDAVYSPMYKNPTDVVNLYIGGGNAVCVLSAGIDGTAGAVWPWA